MLNCESFQMTCGDDKGNNLKKAEKSDTLRAKRTKFAKAITVFT